MPSLHRFTDWLFHFKLSQDTMPADQPFEATHILQWRYRDTKPLRKALEAFQFEKKDIRIRSTKQGTTIEVQLPRGRELTKEQREQLLRMAHEIKDQPCPQSDSDDDD